MQNVLEQFKIVKLNGGADIHIQKIQNNTLILVGENGSGKTTFLRILYHFLSGRWAQLVQFRFESIVAVISGKEFTVKHADLANSNKFVDRKFLSILPQHIRQKVSISIKHGELGDVDEILEKYGVRHHMRAEMMLRDIDFADESAFGIKKEFKDAISSIRSKINAQILYLPTYRRIERELSSIFEGMETNEIRRSRERHHQIEMSDSYVELVEFGMKDVQSAVDNTLMKLKEFARENLNTLTLGYLGDVVNEEYKNVGTQQIENVTEETVRSVLNRIHDSILNENQRTHLFTVINSARNAKSPSEHEKIIYHYFLKLLEFQKSLQQMERQMSDFCDLCSGYLIGKDFVYDSASFSFKIEPTSNVTHDRDILLSDLSSGEKQIVSLFSHLYLSSHRNFFVLIDEPELSLSVPWQRRFLADIRNGDYCKGLVAVTHSPFIYENDLRSFTHSLGEFVSF